jgi:hypothetical protein
MPVKLAALDPLILASAVNFLAQKPTVVDVYRQRSVEYRHGWQSRGNGLQSAGNVVGALFGSSWERGSLISVCV